MKFNNLIIITFCITLIYCEKKQKEEKVVKVLELDITKDKCFFFINDKADTLKFERYLKILENTLSDSIILGMSVLVPKQIGAIEYNKFKDREDILIDLRYTNPLADRICVGLYKEKEPKGILKIELTYQKKERE